MVMAKLLFARERHERNVSAPLHCDRYLPLMPCTVAGDAARKDFASLGQEKAERLHVLVINEGCLVHAEPTHFLPDLEPSPLVRAFAVSAVSFPWSAIR